MPQPNQERAAHAVAAWLAAHERNQVWLSEQAVIDEGTLTDFLKGRRKVQTRTQGRIEKALGWPAGTIRQIVDGALADDAVSTLVSANPSAGPKPDVRFPAGQNLELHLGYVFDLLKNSGGDPEMAVRENVQNLADSLLDLSFEQFNFANEKLGEMILARRELRGRSITDEPQNLAGEENQDTGESDPA